MALGLLALIVGLLAGMAREYSSIITFSSSQDTQTQAGEGLATLTRELEQSCQIVEPVAPGPLTFSRVIFRKLNAASAYRYDSWVPPDYQPWQPLRDQDLLTVSYAIYGTELVREEQNGGRTVVARDVNDFSAKFPSSESLEFRLTVLQNRRLKTFTGAAYRWVH